MNSNYPHITPNLKDWPIYKVSERRTEFINELNEYTRERLLADSKLSVEELLEKTIYLEKLRSKNNPWKVDPADDKSYWKDLEKEIRQAKNSDNSEAELIHILERIINRYNEEIVGNFKIKTFKFARKFLGSLFRRLLFPFKIHLGKKPHIGERLKVKGHVDELRSLFNKGTIVIVPTHFSNLDSILIGYGIDAVAGVPAFAYGAGLNLLDNEIVAYFINRLGAYRVDRRKKNPIYLECLKAQACYSLRAGVNQIFFPGGTRSRNGKLEDKLKLGLLGSMVEAQRHAIVENKVNKIYVIPVVLNYHFVLEAKSLIDQYLRRTGKEKYTRSRHKGKPSGELMRFLWALIKKKSDIQLSFGEPMDVFGHKVDMDGNSLDKDGNIIDITGYFKIEGEVKTVAQREKVYTKLLGDKIVDSFLVNNVVLSSHLIAFAAFRILRAQNRELNLYDALNVPLSSFTIKQNDFEEVVGTMLAKIKLMHEEGKIHISGVLERSVPEIIEDGLSNLGLYHAQRVLYKTNEGTLMSENFRLLFYYHNRLDSYKLEESVNWVKIFGNGMLSLEENE